jgi:hypothetical protein
MNFLLYLPILSLIAYVPLVCYLDIRHREIDVGWWFPLWFLNAPLSLYLYYLGTYNAAQLFLSVIACVFCFIAMEFKVFQGADLLYLWAIDLFFVTNPFPVPHGIPLISFYIYMIPAYIALLAPYYFRKDWNITKRPMMLSISAALLMAVVWG